MSEEQRLAALKKANEVRRWRAEVKRELKCGQRLLAPLLIPDLHERMETMRVFDLLCACPKIGRVKANAICRQLSVRPSIYLPRLSPPRRQQLVDAVEGSGRSRSR